MIIIPGFIYSSFKGQFCNLSFPMRCSADWNRLPDYGVGGDTALGFKTHLDTVLRRRPFDLDQIY